jgi:hypothetical protein
MTQDTRQEDTHQSGEWQTAQWTRRPVLAGGPLPPAAPAAGEPCPPRSAGPTATALAHWRGASSALRPKKHSEAERRSPEATRQEYRCPWRLSGCRGWVGRSWRPLPTGIRPLITMHHKHRKTLICTSTQIHFK